MRQKENTLQGLNWPFATARALAVYVVAGGLASLSGWIFDVERLTSWDGSGISIQPNATIAATATGLGVLFLLGGRRRVSLVLGTFVAMIGFATLLEYATGADFAIDS